MKIQDYSSKASNYCYKSTQSLIDNFNQDKCKVSLATLCFLYKEDTGKKALKVDLKNLRQTVSSTNRYTLPFSRGEAEPHLEPLIPDEKIHSNNIGSYIDRLDKTDVLCIRSNMMTYKTQNLKEILNVKDKKILLITFRITLADSFIREFGEYGFQLYSDIKKNSFEDIPKLVVQIDSLHKVFGKYDLIVFDEFTYTLDHLHSFVKEKHLVWETLLQYIKQTDKIIVLDALLDNHCINFFKKLKDIVYVVENTWKSLSNRTYEIIQVISMSGTMISLIKKYISQGKNVYIPTNSKYIGEKLLAYFKALHINVTMACDTNNVPLNDWNKYQIFISTPTNGPGVSFNEKHFDEIVAYGTNVSCTPYLFAQQLLRVRNITSNHYSLFINYQGIHHENPTTIEDIEKYLQKKDNLLNITGLSYNRPTKEIVKDFYYDNYIQYLKKVNTSRLNFETILKNILNIHGMTESNYEHTKEYLVNNQTILQETIKYDTESKDLRNKIKEDELELVVKAPLISQIEYESNKTKRKTKDDEYKQRKYKIVDTYGIEDFDASFLKKFEPVQQQYKNIKITAENPNLTEFIHSKISDIYEKSNIEYLHNNLNFMKIYACDILVKQLGFEDIFDTNTKIKEIPYNVLIPFFQEYGEHYNYLYDKSISWHKYQSLRNCNLNKTDFDKMEVGTEKDITDRKKSFIQYINSFLKTTFNLSIGNTSKSNNKGYKQYGIIGIGVWDKIKKFNKKQKKIITAPKFNMVQIDTNVWKAIPLLRQKISLVKC